LTAVVVGFAFRDIGENFLAGLMLASSRPFNSGDTIQSGDFMGRVTLLDLRYTRLKTFDGKDVYLPNSFVFKNPLINFTQDGLLRLEFTVGLDYTDDLEPALATVFQAVKAVDGVLAEPDPLVVVDTFSASTVDLKTYFWVNTFDYRKGRFELQSDVMCHVKEALQTAGFGLPAQVVELKLYDRAEPLDVRFWGAEHDDPR
jgi:small-conductance mechanosensitive channel